jgi:hypothetical protein
VLLEEGEQLLLGLKALPFEHPSPGLPNSPLQQFGKAGDLVCDLPGGGRLLEEISDLSCLL